MPIIRLIIKGPAPVRRANAPHAFKSTNLGRFYFPIRGLHFSLLIHVIAFLGLQYAKPSIYIRIPDRAPEAQVQFIDLTEPQEVMWLPELGGGDPGMAAPGGGSGDGPKRPPAASDPGNKGFSYPGPQAIVSDVANATNEIQTVLQPALVNPPVLKPPIALPNIVLMADTLPPAQIDPPVPEPPKPPQEILNAPAAVPAEAKTVETALPVSRLTPPMDAPKVVPVDAWPETIVPEPEIPPKMLPPMGPPTPKVLPVPKETAVVKPPPKPAAPPKEITAKGAALTQTPSKSKPVPLPTRGTDPINLLSLTPMPAARAGQLEIPSGEARGSFAISPNPNLDASETRPGSKTGVETGRPSALPSGNAAAGNVALGAAAGAGGRGDAAKDKVTAAGGAGGNAGRGTGSGSGNGPGVGAGTGAGTGANSARGTGAGSGTGPGTGSGSGSGNGPGGGFFGGITIIGGVGNTGSAANSSIRPPPPKPLQTAFGYTVISTESSGGGLPVYEVFGQEQIYTVFLDMRQVETDPDRSWTLEFSVIQETSAQANAAGNPTQSQQGIVLPFPSVKEQPALPADIVRQHVGKMIIVFGIVNLDGKLEQIAVKESPDPMFNQPVIDALGKWVFKPAKLNGEPARAKVLMGIPLWLPNQ